MKKIDALKRTEFFGSLPVSVLREVEKASLEVRLKKGEVLYTAGMESKGLYVIVQGYLRAVLENTEGREQVLYIEKTGDTIAELPVFDHRPYLATVVAEEEARLLFISNGDVRRFCLAYPAIALAALRVFALRLRKFAALTRSLSLLRVDQRLAAFLLAESSERRTREFKIPNNSTLASHLGTVREVLSRAFSKLEKKGFIAVGPRRNLRILDKKGLWDYCQ